MNTFFSGKNVCLASQFAPEIWLKKGMERGVCSCSRGKKGVPMPKLDLFKLKDVYDARREEKVPLNESFERKISLHCALCDYKTEDRSHFKRHNESHDKGIHVGCGRCDKKFISKSLFNEHLEAFHNVSQRKECPLEGCRKKVVNLAGHMWMHKQGREKFHVCSCGERFSISYHLKRHREKKGCN